MRELEVQPEQPRHQQQIDDVGIGEHVEHALAGRHLHAAHGGVGNRERHGPGRRPGPCGPMACVSRLRKSGATISMTFFASASRSPIATLWRTACSTQSSLRPRCCAIVARKGRGEVLDLLTHRALDVLAALLDRMRRADGRSRRHRRDVRGFRDEGAGRRGARARRRDVDDHRDRRGEHGLDDLLRGAKQPARRVELDHQRAGAFGLGRRERVVDVGRSRRIDRAVDRDQLDPRRRCAAAFAGASAAKNSLRYEREHDRDRRDDESDSCARVHDAEPPRRGIGIPRYFMTSWMSAHTSRLSPGLRSRYAG